MSDDSEDSFTEAAALEDFVVLFLCFPHFPPFLAAFTSALLFTQAVRQ